MLGIISIASGLRLVLPLDASTAGVGPIVFVYVAVSLQAYSWSVLNAGSWYVCRVSIVDSKTKSFPSNPEMTKGVTTLLFSSSFSSVS
jgi:hypothetical protein